MRQSIVVLPELAVTASAKVRTELDPETLQVRYTAEIHGGHSTRDMTLAFERARRELARVPELIAHAEIKIDRHAAAALQAAADKRARRGKRGW